jgi:hypothetical protein
MHSLKHDSTTVANKTTSRYSARAFPFTSGVAASSAIAMVNCNAGPPDQPIVSFPFVTRFHRSDLRTSCPHQSNSEGISSTFVRSVNLSIRAAAWPSTRWQSVRNACQDRFLSRRTKGILSDASRIQKACDFQGMEGAKL